MDVAAADAALLLGVFLVLLSPDDAADADADAVQDMLMFVAPPRWNPVLTNFKASPPSIDTARSIADAKVSTAIALAMLPGVAAVPTRTA